MYNIYVKAMLEISCGKPFQGAAIGKAATAETRSRSICPDIGNWLSHCFALDLVPARFP
jgi:hypothetical protein